MLDEKKLEASCLTVEEFGQRLIETGDLDPVYVGLVGAYLPTSQLERWLLAYWCFYHAGAASWLSEHEGADFWRWMYDAAANDIPPPPKHNQRWPRAAERRHFRGEKCVRAVEDLRQVYGAPEAPVRDLRTCQRGEQIVMRVRGWPQFGPWIAFKAADMMERCAGSSIDFASDLGLMYAEPREALDILAEERAPRTAPMIWDDLLRHFRGWTAPPRQRRGTAARECGPQEVETVLCKWKSHRAGHYRVGKDIKEVREGLHGWGETAARMLAAMPEDIL